MSAATGEIRLPRRSSWVPSLRETEKEDMVAALVAQVHASREVDAAEERHDKLLQLVFIASSKVLALGVMVFALRMIGVIA